MPFSRNAGILLSAAIFVDCCFSGGTITVATLGFSSIIESAVNISPSIFGGLATTLITKEKGSGFRHELENVIQQSVEKTLSAVESDFFDKDEFRVSWWREQFIRFGFDIPDSKENYLIRQSLHQNFFVPLYKFLSDDKAIEEFISQNSQLNAGDMLEKILSTNQIKVPEYLEKYEKNLQKSVVNAFKSNFLDHFSEILLKNEPARKYYQTLLLQSSFDLLQSTFRQVENQSEQIKNLIKLAKYHNVKLEGVEETILESFQKQSHAMDQLRQDYLRQFGLALDIRKKRSEDERNQFSYVSLFTDFQGRTLEMDILCNFLNDDRKFLFYALSGSGGSGKSRLANQLCLQAESMHWLSGFSDKDSNSLFRWESLQTTANTLIVLDYVRGRKGQVVQILNSLSSLADKNLFENKVRVLLLERSFDEDLTREIFTPRTREYFYSYLINQKEKPLELAPMKDDVRWAIIEQILLRNPGRYKEFTLRRMEIIEALDRQDPEKRPLFTFFSAVALLEGKDISHWNTKDNLDYHLQRLENKIWNQVPIWKKFKTPIKHLIWLGAICEYLENKDFENFQNCQAFAAISEEWQSEDFWNELTQIFSFFRSEGSVGDFPGIKPDLLAEHFIVTHISKCSKIPPLKNGLITLFQLAWQIRPECACWMSYLTISNYLNEDNQPISCYLQWLELENEPLLKNEYAANLFYGIGILFYVNEDLNNSKKWLFKSAELGNSRAYYMLGITLEEEDPDEAMNWHLEAAFQGNIDSIEALARLNRSDDPKEAMKWYRMAAELGSISAMNNLAKMLGENDPNLAMEWYRKAAELGNEVAMDNLALLLKENDPNLAISWFRKAAELGNINAMHNLAFLLEKNDPKQAMDWYRRASKLGFSHSMHNLALLLEKDDIDEAKEWYKKAAELGLINSINNLADLLLEVDPVQARDWYKKAADLGDIIAINNIAYLLLKVDPEQARDWYKKAADLGDINAINNLADLLIEDDPDQAMEWYRKAAKLGNDKAMNKLAIILQDDNPKQAIEWYIKAVELGNDNAIINWTGLIKKVGIETAINWFKIEAEKGDFNAIKNLSYLLVDIDPEQAMYWLKWASNLGDAIAMKNLALLLIDLDPEQANIWFRKSAELGNINAMFNLALMLQNENPQLAMDWYQKAAELGEIKSMFTLSQILIKDDPEKALDWLKMASTKGHFGAKYKLVKHYWEKNTKPKEAWKLVNELLENPENLSQDNYIQFVWLWLLISAWTGNPAYQDKKHSILDLLAVDSPKTIEYLWVLLYHDYSNYLLSEFENGIHADFLKNSFPIFYLVILHFQNPESPLLENILAEYKEEFKYKIQTIKEKRHFYNQ